MLRASITFFILGIVSMLLGINSIAGLSIDIGKILLGVFLVLSVLSFLFDRSRNKRPVLVAFIFLSFVSGHALADNDAQRAVKNAVRSAKDRTCTLVKGKMECAVQKVKHTIEKGADKVEDIID